MATIIKESVEISTFHGISRVASSKSNYFRIFWIILCFGCIIGFGIQVRLLALKFWNSSITTSADIRGMKFEFPNIFICQDNPFSFSYFMFKTMHNSSDLFTLQKNLDKINNFQAEVLLDAKTRPLNRNHFFWETQPRKQLIEIVKQPIAQTISRLFIQGREVFVTGEDSHAQLKLHYSRHKLYCIQIAVTPEESLEETVNVITHSDDNQSKEYMDFVKQLGFANKKMNGLRMYFTQPGTMPAFESDYVYIRSGYYYDIHLKMNKYSLMNSSSNTCYKAEVTFIDPLHPQLTNYSQGDLFQDCSDKAIQDFLTEECGCYDLQLTRGLITSTVYNKYPACFNVSEYLFSGSMSNYSALVERFKCYSDFKSKVRKGIRDKICKKFVPCVRHIYHPYWSFMKWPSENSVADTLEEYVQKPYNDRRRRGIPAPGWRYILNMTHPEQIDKAIRGSLSRVEVSPQEFFSTVIQEYEHYTFFNLFSDIGGTLGLFLGGSMLSVVEIVELLHNLLATHSFFRKETRKSMYEKYSKHGEVSVSVSDWI